MTKRTRNKFFIGFCIFFSSAISVVAGELEHLRQDMCTAEKVLRNNLRNKEAAIFNKNEIQEAFQSILTISNQIRILYPTMARSFYESVSKEIASDAVDNATLLQDIAIYTHVPSHETIIQGIILSQSSLHIIDLAAEKTSPSEQDITDDCKNFLDSLETLKEKKIRISTKKNLPLSSFHISNKWHPSQQSIINLLWMFFLICAGVGTLFIAALLIQHFFFSPRHENNSFPQNDHIRGINGKKETLEENDENNEPEQLVQSFKNKKKKLESLIKTISQAYNNQQDGNFLENFFPISSVNAVVRFFFKASSFISIDTLVTVLQKTTEVAKKNQPEYSDDIYELEERFKQMKKIPMW